MSLSNCWLSDEAKSMDCICLGTGRFLRSVLVPALVEAQFKSALIQTRGSNFLEYMTTRTDGTYEVDTVLSSGEIQVSTVSCHAAFTLGTVAGKNVWMEFLKRQTPSIQLIGVGVTEAGLASSQTQAMQELFHLLAYLRLHNTYNSELCVVDMDNVPDNGDTIRSHMIALCGTDNIPMRLYLETRVVFCNTMVDRITSQREGSDGLVPRCEPLPNKALVILDANQRLPKAMRKLTHLGVVVRSTAEQLDADIALKLRVANGTHTALAHCMALMGLLNTDILSHGGLLMDYLDSLFESQILTGSTFGTLETKLVYDDWRRRLTHPHFGLSTFFITQNGSAKGGIRLGPTLIDLLEQGKPITTCMVYAWAALLRWLTPTTLPSQDGVYTGWLDGARHNEMGGENVTYADGLRYNLEAGWYEFKCACNVLDRPLSACLGEIASTATQPSEYATVVRAYLMAPDGGNLSRVAQKSDFEVLVQAISTMLGRMVVCDGIKALLNEMSYKTGIYDQGFVTNANVLCWI